MLRMLLIKGSIALDNFKQNVISILEEYKDISILEETEHDCIVFELQKNKYGILMLDDKSFPIVVAIDNGDNYPHFMFAELAVGTAKWRSICLFESGTMIEYIHTEKEKIRLCIERLLGLVNLSPSEIEEEYHKEFLLYWKKYGLPAGRKNGIKYQLYLDDSQNFQWLELHKYKNNCIRITSANRFFNDNDKYMGVDITPALYLPLDDTRGLLPPLKNKPWDAHTINDIICGVVYQRISIDAFAEIAHMSYSKREILFVFSFRDMYFGCIVEFKNPGTAKLLTKVESQITNVLPVDISRCDFEFLNGQIGNTVHNEHIVVVGAGSLGSYIIDELAHSGYRNITVVDGDLYEYANVFRHRSRFFGSALPKSQMIEIEVSWIHPEICIHSVNQFLSSENFDKCIPEGAHTIIFAVGSSDIQLQINALMIGNKHKAHAIYAWLEHDGKTSHVAAVRTSKEGCFECLFTDDEGKLCNNTVNCADPSTLHLTRNGCGGTRVHYGNRTLLTASALVLNALEDDSKHNTLYSFINGAMQKRTYPQNARCACCGIREKMHQISVAQRPCS